MNVLVMWNRLKGAIREIPVVGPTARFFYRLVKAPLALFASFAPQPVVVNVRPALSGLTSQIVTQEQMESDVFARWADAMKHPLTFHRKLWEYVYILQALEETGDLASGKRGVGFGVGKEPLAAVMAHRGCELVTTDLPPDDARKKGWADTNQYSPTLLDMNDKGICDEDEFLRRVTYRHVNMNAIPDDLVGFDFAWSCCAMEHLGSITNGLRFVHSSLKCIRPGGVAVHTTEFNLSSNDWTLSRGGVVLFRRKDIERLAGQLLKDGHEIVLNFTTGDKELDVFVDVPPYKNDPAHIKLLVSNYVTTSIGLIIRKKP